MDFRSSIRAVAVSFRDKTEEPLPSGLERERIIVGIDFGLATYHHHPPLFIPASFPR